MNQVEDAVQQFSGTESAVLQGSKTASEKATGKILIVDDDPDIRLGMALRLRASGHQVWAAGDVNEGVKLACWHQPDIVLLDLGLGEEDGFVLMRCLRQIPELCNTPIVVVSGRDPKANRRRALDAGARSFLQKPVENAVLLSVVGALLEQRPVQPIAAGQI